MKVSPLSQGTGAPGVDIGAVSLGRVAPDKIAAAKAIASGETPTRSAPPQSQDPQVERMRKIKMRTQVSPDRAIEEMAEEPSPMAEPQSPISPIDESVASEETKPLSPQFAALAKQRRALQIERAKFEQDKAQAASATTDGSSVSIDRIKQDPMRVLREIGVTYDDLTQAVLNDQHNPEIAELKAEIKALKEGVDKNFVDRDTQAEQQVLAEMRREANQLVSQGDTFEMVRATGMTPKAIELIHRTYKQTGEIMDVSEALGLIEDDLINQNLKLAQLPKLQSRLVPAQPPPQTQQPQRETGMRTLTNRDNARPVATDRRSRALAAALNMKR